MKNDDLVEGNDIKMLERFVTSNTLDEPIFYPGSNVGDFKIDTTLNKFMEKQQIIDKTVDVENYDDDVFKKRDHDYVKQKQLTQLAMNQTSLQSRSHQRLQLREREYDSKRMMKPINQNNRYSDNQIDPPRLASRDERLKAPRSALSMQTKNRLKSSKIMMQAITKADPMPAGKPSGESPYKNGYSFEHTFESLGSKRKKLLQMTNQTIKADPFGNKNRPPSQAAHLNRHLRVSQVS